MKNYKILYLFLIAVVLTACKPEIESFTPTAGNADFTKYISLGNSLTAGYLDGDLFMSGQQVSYPNLIAGQLKTVGGGDFKQPLMYDDLGFGRRLVLNLNTVRDCFGQPIPVEDAPPALGPFPLAMIDPKTPDPRNFTNSQELHDSHNLGVPGAKSFHLLVPGYGGMNPYFARFAAAPAISVIQQAASLNPTFFSLWVGNNDILTYAMTGGEQDSLTSVQLFSYAYSTLLTALTANGAKGVVANIPDITNIAHFTTFPYNGLALTSEVQVAGLNAGYAQLGIVFQLGPNPFIIADPEAIGGLRQIKSNELLLLSLPQDSIKCRGWGSLKPIPARYVLDEGEIANIKEATQQLNAVIESLAASNGLAFVNANAIFNNIRTGLVYDGARFNASYITGGINSLDGVHLTPRGNAIVANFFIEAINAKYESHIPLVNVTDYPGIIFP